MSESDNVTDEQSGTDNLEQRIRTLEDEITTVKEENKELKKALDQHQGSGLPNVSRRQTLGLLGGGALLGAVGSASAAPPSESGGPPFADEDHDHSGDHLGKSDPVAQMDITNLDAENLSGITVLQDEMDEAEVRTKVANAGEEDAFLIPRQANWVLKDTLHIPSGATIIGFDKGRMGILPADFTFRKGFDGPLATIINYCRLQDVSFRGEKENYKGDGIIFKGEVDKNPYAWKGLGSRANRLVGVVVRKCAGDGIVFNKSYMNYFNKCNIADHDGWGIRHAKSKSHHSQNLFQRSEIHVNSKGGILYNHIDHTTTYDSVSIFGNQGPAFEFRDSSFHLHGSDGHNIVVRGSNFINNEGPVWLHRGGDATNIAFKDCQMWQNVEGPASDLTDPVGQFHIEDGSADIEIGGGVALGSGSGHLYTATKNSSNHNLEINGSARKKLKGDVYGPNTYLTLQNTSLLTGNVNVQSGIGLNPNNGGSVEHYGPLEEPEGPNMYSIETRSLSINGDVAELSNVANLTLADDFTVYSGNPTVRGPVWLTWDSSNLYLAADLTDNVHLNPNTSGKLYAGDVIQLGVAEGLPDESTTFAEFTIALGTNGPQVVKRVIPGGGTGTIDVPMEIVRDNQTNSTIYEIAIPWGEVPTTPSAERFGASMTVGDSDKNNVRSGLLEWGGGIYGGKNASLFNIVELNDN